MRCSQKGQAKNTILKQKKSQSKCTRINNGLGGSSLEKKGMIHMWVRQKNPQTTLSCTNNL